MNDQIIKFIRQKDYHYLKEIGQGGLGRTVLLKDDIINEVFVCKKYSPIEGVDKDVYFKNFVDEIKLLHLVYHKNVVRVFNYFLYPSETTGYIFMEYVNGVDIQEYVKKNPDKLTAVFKQAISGFDYLQSQGILHRDIRPTNILVSDEGIVKIIDFGFGKQIEFSVDFGKSISLNWWYTPPDEFVKKIYDFKTEIYFLGKLFEEIVVENNIQNFSYLPLLKQMTARYEVRASSFFSIVRGIVEGTETDRLFSETEQQVYRNFAKGLFQVIDSFLSDIEYISDVDSVVVKLENLYRSSMLEEMVQSNSNLIQCFVKGGFVSNSYEVMPVEDLKSFQNLLKVSSSDKRKILLNHIWNRFDNVPRYSPNLNRNSTDELPF